MARSITARRFAPDGRERKRYRKRCFLTSELEDEAVRLHLDDGLSLTAISKRLGVTITPVQRVMRERGIEFPAQQRWSRQLRAKTATAYAGGETSVALAKRLHTTPAVILNIVRGEGVPIRFQARVFSEADELDIVACHIAGALPDDIAARYGVFHKRIIKVLRQRGAYRASGRTRAKRPVWTDNKGRSHTFRSTWELFVATRLDAQDIAWDYEVQRYAVVLAGRSRYYKPDFWVYDETGTLVALIDVKGHGTDEQRERITAFVAQYPKLPFKLWDAAILHKMGLREFLKNYRTSQSGRSA